MQKESSAKFQKIETELTREASNAQARSDAFAFAVKCQADLNRIQGEIESEGLAIQSALSNNSYGDNNPMKPGAGPRVFRDAYISGLRDAITLIRRMSESESG